MAVELHDLVHGNHLPDPHDVRVLGQRSLEPRFDLGRVGRRGAKDDLHARRELRGRLEQIEDPLLIRDATDEEHVRLADASTRQHVARLGSPKLIGVDAVVDDDHPLGGDAKMGQDVLAHLT